MNGRESGSIAPQYLAVLFLIFALASGAATVLSAGTNALRRSVEADRRNSAALLLVDSLEKELIEDQTPAIDSADDPFWARDNTEDGGFSIQVLPVSDSINPDFVRKNVFEKTGLSSLLMPGASADELQQYREDNGLQLVPESWAEFIDKDVYANYFSCYGWANINLIDEFAARSLATALTGSDSAGEEIRVKIQNLLSTQRLETTAGLGTLLGANFESLYPAFNAEPSMNINFVPELILRELLSYPDYHIDNPGARTSSILSLRETKAIDMKEIPGLLGVDANNRILCYFGSITWFREIRLEDKRGTFSVIVARIPPEHGEEMAKPQYRRIEIRHTR